MRATRRAHPLATFSFSLRTKTPSSLAGLTPAWAPGCRKTPVLLQLEVYATMFRRARISNADEHLKSVEAIATDRALGSKVT